jgi:hypothetical protein
MAKRALTSGGEPRRSRAYKLGIHVLTSDAEQRLLPALEDDPDGRRNPKLFVALVE